MEARRPEIDMDKLHDFLEADKAYQDTHDAPKDPPARFCGTDCRQSYREERVQGKPLPMTSINGQPASHKTMCAQFKLCAYCLSKLEK